MPRCGACGGRSFAVETGLEESLLICAGCDLVVGSAAGARLASIERELNLLRDEVARLRQAVGFLNQRVR